MPLCREKEEGREGAIGWSTLFFSFYYTEGMIPCSGAANQLGGGIVNLSVGKGAPHGSSDMSPGPGWAVPVGFRERYLMSNLG